MPETTGLEQPRQQVGIRGGAVGGETAGNTGGSHLSRQHEVTNRESPEGPGTQDVDLAFQGGLPMQSNSVTAVRGTKHCRIVLRLAIRNWNRKMDLHAEKSSDVLQLKNVILIQGTHG